MGSITTACAPVFTAPMQRKELTVAHVQQTLRVAHPDTARRIMRDLDGKGVMEFIEEAPDKAALLRFRPEWAWWTSPESWALLRG